MSFFELEGIVKEDLGVKHEFCLWYHLPNAVNFMKGLKRVTDDICVGKMFEVAVENKALSVYVVNDKDNEMLVLEISKSGTKDSEVLSTVGNRKKLTPKRASKAKESLSESCIPLEYDFSEDEPHFGNSAKEDEDEISEELVQSQDLSSSFEELEQVGDSVLKLGECSNTQGLYEYENSDHEDDDATIDFRKSKWIFGQVFSTPVEFKEAVRKYAIHQRRNVRFYLSDKSKLNKLCVKCIDGCPFKLYASWDKTRASFIVKKFNGDHTCQRNMDSNRQFKASWGFAYKIKYAAHRRLHGSMKQHYQKLMSYVGVLERSNPNSHFVVVTDPSTNPPTFQRFFVCFKGVKDGWVGGCKKILGIDGCFLKTFLGGMLLSAVGRDPNEQMYPLAWAVVEGENNESWQWFISELKKSVPHDNGKEWILISEKHQSILRAVQLELPKAEHRHCARHIYANWNKSFKGEEMKLLFWRCVKAYNLVDFEEAISEMEDVNPIVVDAFRKCGPHLFCRSFVKLEGKCDVIL
ncbi:uncharacterized protein LOC130815669 [Amaranthus tricolor]|uniref:uncharacterized protein LOC130815669 n=1 Tax=Amaranthus tricolor TaxID=29722 RepID=UPI002590F3DE|nr:uncharacterized protein LOC130815669 [Amaranthus tricolor]